METDWQTRINKIDKALSVCASLLEEPLEPEEIQHGVSAVHQTLLDEKGQLLAMGQSGYALECAELCNARPMSLKICKGRLVEVEVG